MKHGDIIDLPHPTPRSRKRMPLRDRAAQFAPFSALSGFGEVIEKASQPAERERFIAEDEADLLDMLYRIKEAEAERQ